ncbi:uncharacterized protein LOC116245697 [Nymphaea colorata]|uniref:DUF3741 domain-containing protein n=1 Tax=Nymphaea colorata TaxID=210225 RepID=A0A5K0W0E4_9MAGN|nr:uncharacterized protein LOC116245697 [Nymphaea colorata]
MKKGFRNFCNGVASTSTLKQGKPDHLIATTGDGGSSCMLQTPSLWSSSCIEDMTTLHDHLTAPAPTLEEMVARLDMEEAAARRAKLAQRRWPGRLIGLPEEEDEEEEEEARATTIRRRMSCVNNSDILKSARNALNQYPRFSLDGRDSLYRSSFQNRLVSAKLISGKQTDTRFGLETGTGKNRSGCVLPATLGGQTVAWCKPGIIPKLMGLELIPVPLFYPTSTTKSKQKNGQRSSSGNSVGMLEKKSACLKGRTCTQAGVHSCGRTGGLRHMGRPLHGFEAAKKQGSDWHIGRIR